MRKCGSKLRTSEPRSTFPGSYKKKSICPFRKATSNFTTQSGEIFPDNKKINRFLRVLTLLKFIQFLNCQFHIFTYQFPIHLRKVYEPFSSIDKDNRFSKLLAHLKLERETCKRIQASDAHAQGTWQRHNSNHNNATQQQNRRTFLDGFQQRVSYL